MFTPEVQTQIIVEVLGIAFFAGIYVATIIFHGKIIKSVVENQSKQGDKIGVHDREIEGVYTRLQMVRR